jgi:hypothetical protein
MTLPAAHLRTFAVRAAVVFGACTAFAALTACGPRIEYRARPGFATSAELPDEVVLDDGTIIRYLPVNEFLAMKRARERGETWEPGDGGAGTRASASAEESADGEPARPSFLPWEEDAEGRVRMQAKMPEQVVANAMRAFREERYGELWEQMVSRSVRERATREAEGDADAARVQFAEWCGRGREDVMKLLNRMSFGFSTNAVIMRKSGPALMQLELTPQIAGDFRYRIVEIAYEETPVGQRVMLAGIR